MISIKIGGRSIPLLFNLQAFFEMKENDLSLSNLRELFSKEAQQDKYFEVLAAVVTITRILGNQGLEMAGQEHDLTDIWLRKHLRPGQILPLKVAIAKEVDAGMSMETNERKENEERDLVLEEINQKKTSES